MEPETIRDGSDDPLVQAALKRGFVRPEQVREALLEQAREVSTGRAKPRTLENILLSNGWLTLDHLMSLRESHHGSAPPPFRYLQKGEIARGGMGAILRISDQSLGRDVAMKVMLDDSDETSRVRFQEEAKVTGQLEHPNIVPVHELGVDAEGRPFFTMKLVQGRSLAEILRHVREGKDGAFSQHRLLTLFTNVCNGIAFAHSKGVVHRDLKPANIMVGDYGEVLVMDWGLAKAGAARSSGSNLQAKSREPGAGDLTMDGAVMGTPHYMPPEQALGEIAKIDERSDVYSLGAILYEILVLKPPVEGTTVQALLRNVAEGRITRPEQRAPDRGVPRELSAIAMKALSREPGDRYPGVEALRRDVELFLEGRAVSAKTDTAWETLVKLVRRNRAASAAIAVSTAAILGAAAIGSYVNLLERRKAESSAQAAEAARRKTQESLTELQAEQARRVDRERVAATALVEKAIRGGDRGNVQAALGDASLAVQFAPDSLAARQLKADLMIALQDFPGAERELQACLALPGADSGAVSRLMGLCRQAGAGVTPGLATAFSTYFAQRKSFALAEIFLRSREERLTLARERIEAAWKGLGSKLTLMADGTFGLDLSSANVRDLAPLAGLPLSRLLLAKNPVEHLTALQGMPLKHLDLTSTRVADLSPLKGMPLTHLTAPLTLIANLAPIRGMPLVSLSLDNTQVTDLEPLRGARLEVLSLRGLPAVTDFSILKGMPLRVLDLWESRKFSNLSLLAGAPLESLNVSRTAAKDLSPLKGAPLKLLSIGDTPVSDLGPIAGMGLTKLDASATSIADLKPLMGMPLRDLILVASRSIRSFSVIEKLPLHLLALDHTSVNDAELALLRGNRTLHHLSIQYCRQVTRLPPLAGVPIQDLYLGGASIRDLRELAGLGIVRLGATPENFAEGLPPADSLKSLMTFFLGYDRLVPMTPQQFFQKYGGAPRSP